MTRQRDKNIERHYVEFCALKLGVAWTIVEESEAPDFILSDASGPFGLEVTQAFVDSASAAGGSGVRQREGAAQKSLDRIRRAYVDRTGAMISVLFTQRPRVTDEQKIIEQLIALNLQDQPIGALAEIQRPGGLRLLVRRTPSQNWRIVADSAGWVDQQGHIQLQHRIAQKSPATKTYRAGLSDLRLLVVADADLNSGKLRVDANAVIDPAGFTRIYFLAYPLEVMTFPKS